MTRYAALALSTILITAAGSAQPADRCHDILKYGIFNESYLSSDHVDYGLFQSAACSNKTEQDRKTIGQNLKYLTPTLDYAESWSASSDDQKYELVCQNNLQETFTRDTLDVFVKKASDVIVDAWKACMTTESGRRNFSSRYSQDLRDVSLEVDSGVRDLPLAFFGKKRWQDQIQVVPKDAITACERGFSTTQTRDAISCTRNEKRLDEIVSIKLLSQFGEQPTIELPSKSSLVKGDPEMTGDVYLSKQLELPGNTFLGITYGPRGAKSGKGYQHYVVYGATTGVSVVTYRIPRGARSFVADVIPYAEPCDTCCGGINGWRIFARTSVATTEPFEQYHYYTSEKKLELPVDDIPEHSPRLLTISVDSGGYRTCDHSGLGDPHFSRQPVSAVGASKKQ